MDCIHHLTLQTTPAGFLSQRNKIWSTLFPLPPCVFDCFCSFRRCFSTECSCGHSRDCTSVPEGCTKVRPPTSEKGQWLQAPAVDKLPLQFTTWINQPHLHTNTAINPNTYHTQGQQEEGARRDEPKLC